MTNAINGFRLQPVLSYRERREELVETELGRLRHACQQEEQGLARMQAMEAETLDAMARWQKESANLDVKSMDQQLTYLSWLGRRVNFHAQRVEQARQQVAGKRQELVVASQEKMVLEKLKARNEQAAEQADQRAENKRVDEISIVQFHLRRSGANR